MCRWFDFSILYNTKQQRIAKVNTSFSGFKVEEKKEKE